MQIVRDPCFASPLIQEVRIQQEIRSPSSIFHLPLQVREEWEEIQSKGLLDYNGQQRKRPLQIPRFPVEQLMSP